MGSWIEFVTDVLYPLQYPYFASAIAPVAKHLEEHGVRLYFTTMQNGHDDAVRRYASSILPEIPWLSPFTASSRAWNLVLFGSSRHQFSLRDDQKVGLFPHGGCLGGNQTLSTPLAYFVRDKMDVLFAHNDGDARLFAKLFPRESGQASIKVIGWPKIDRLFDDSVDRELIRAQLDFQHTRPLVVLAGHFSEHSMLRTNLWNVLATLDSLQTLNIVVTVHPLALLEGERVLEFSIAGMMERLAEHVSIRFIPAEDPTELLAVADLFVTDHSSIVCEMIARTKPILYFSHPEHHMCDDTLFQRIQSATNQFTYANDLPHLVAAALENPTAKFEPLCAARDSLYAHCGHAASIAAKAIAEEARNS